MRMALALGAMAGMLAIAGCSSGGPVATGTGSTAPRRETVRRRLPGVCRGATVPRATAYSAAPSHEVILFSPNGNDVIEDTTALAQDWMVEFDANSDADSIAMVYA